MMSSNSLGYCLALSFFVMIFTTASGKQMFTKEPVIAMKSASNDLPQDEPVLVFVYRSTCPRSQRTMPRFMRAAKILEAWGMKTASLEYNETGWEYMSIVFPLKKFPALVMYPGNGKKIRYEDKDPIFANAEDFVHFAWMNRK